MHRAFILVALLSAWLAEGSSLASPIEPARASFVVETTVVDACTVTLERNAIRAACAPSGLARVTAPLQNGAAGTVSLVAGGAPMRTASALEGGTQVITFTF